MGLKSGSRDAELDEADNESEDPAVEAVTETDDSKKDTGADARSEETKSGSTSPTDTTHNTENPTERPAMSAIPYKLRRDKVNEGREQVPYFLREEIIDAEDELQDVLEDILGEDVYKSDYREAAMVVAQRNPELVAEILREWGYDLKAT